MNNKGALTFGLFAFLTVFCHLMLIQQGFLYGSVKTALIADLALLFLGLMSLLILYTNNSNKDSLTFRFLGITVFQFIGFLSLVGAFIFKEIPDVKYWVVSSMIIFFLFLTLQTILLVRSISSNRHKQSK